ncbi:MAG: leucine-rich repeat domain-containing protein [Anaerolineales bacterium]|nr:leucine-rich repeat domain-containing protein [Anaerolineales bacterium]
MAKDKAYREAEKKIAEALTSHATELDLNGMGLTELPPELWKLTNLKVLKLGYEYSGEKNQLKEIPKEIGQLTQLTFLDLSSNQLTSLPNWLGQLTQLTSLNLFDNKLTALPDSLSQLTQLTSLNLNINQLTTLSDTLGQLTQLTELNLSSNQLTTLPPSLGQLKQLTELDLSNNQLTALPDTLGQLTQLTSLDFSHNQLTSLPVWLLQQSKWQYLDISDDETSSDELSRLSRSLDFLLFGSLRIQASGNKVEFKDIFSWVIQLKELKNLYLCNKQLTDLPPSLAQLEHLEKLDLDKNPLNPALQSAYDQGLDAVKAYLRAKAAGEIVLTEAKLILVGEGEVGKTCLMDALLDKEWQEHPSTHGIEIQSFNANDPKTGKEITLNAWDFGGQRVYRPTHQLFFSAPAVYLVVWKPREGPQQGFVKEWIQLVKRREPSAKIIVVATHGGPQQRQPDIDRQELWDLFGKDTVIDFFFVDSKPDENGKRKGIEELKAVIARVAAALPEVGRSVPKSFADVRAALAEKGVPYLPLDEVLAICRAHNMDDEIARLFITISHRLGHFTHYENDPALHNIVILRPDWLATAMSYVLDDKETRANQGLVKFSRLSQLWNDPARPEDTRYPEDLHRIFLRLMERFDLSYRVAGLSKDEETNPISLIAQLVPDTTPEAEKYNNAWGSEPVQGDIQQTQICRIVDAQSGQSANAEGLFCQLIVRLHKFSLGRTHWDNSVHWQRGLLLDADYNGRALLRHIGNDVHITVRAPYPERFLGMLTEEVKYLVESFWEGLRCDVTVPCLTPNSCAGLFEVEKLIENKKRGRPEVPCIICNEWQNIDQLLLNAPAARPVTSVESLANQAVLTELSELRQVLIKQNDVVMGRFDTLDSSQRELLSKAEASYNSLMQIFTDEAKEGPRLFSMRPVDPNWLEKPKQLVSQKFRILLWCEHSHLPLFILNEESDKRGIYELDLPYEWVVNAAPYLKLVTATLSLILPIAASTTKFVMDDEKFKAIEKGLALGKDSFEAVLKGSKSFIEWVDKNEDPNLSHGAVQRAEGALLRELHAFLKTKDPGFGGLVRVMNKRQEFLWVHEKFASEY